MRIFVLTLISLLAQSYAVSAYSQYRDSLVVAKAEQVTMTSMYTVSLNDVKLKDKNGAVMLKIRTASSARGGNIEIGADKIIFDNGSSRYIVADGLVDGLSSHDYRIVKLGNLKFYMDGVEVAIVMDASYGDETPIVALYGTENLNDGYSVNIDSQVKSIVPDMRDYETNIGNMLDEFQNISEDPYCGKGFIVADENDNTGMFTTSNAVFEATGDVCFDENSFSGNYSIRMEGADATLLQNIDLSANKIYVVRAMVKSDDFKGKIGIDGESEYITIGTTDGQWKQVEGVFATNSKRTKLFVCGDDYASNGVLWIDNIEVYESDGNSSSALADTVLCKMVGAGDTWSPNSLVSVYMLGMTDDGNKYSSIDTSKVKVYGSSFLTKKVKGSQMYSMAFPGNLRCMTATGEKDGRIYQDEPLIQGIDYVLQTFDYPYFKYISTGDSVCAGCYLIQFVDNLDGMNVRFFFDSSIDNNKSSSDYFMEGNRGYADTVPEGLFYKFNESNQRFELTSGTVVKPYEAYISTSAQNPVKYFTPDGSTGIQLLNGTDGAGLSIMPIDGGVEITSAQEGCVDIFNIYGMKVGSARLKCGTSKLNLDKGIYIIGEKKVVVK